MRLTWDVGYEDYADTEHWLPRFAELKLIADRFSIQTAAGLDDVTLLNRIEDISELMRYYCASHDMQHLEPVMRKYNDALQLCRSRCLSGVEPFYLEMLFQRLNAILYRGHGQNKRGAEEYEKCLQTARQCFAALKTARHLSDEQVFFVGWSCIECFREAAQASDVIMDAQSHYRIVQETLPMLRWLEPMIEDAPGICDQASELYIALSSPAYSHGDFDVVTECFGHAYQLLNGLDERIGSDFYRARAIYVLNSYGVLEQGYNGNISSVLRSEKEADEFLATRRPNRRDRAIIDGVKAVVANQRSIFLTQQGKIEEALEIAKNAMAELEVCLDILKEDRDNHDGHYRDTISNVISRMFNSYVVSLNTVGSIAIQDSDNVLAEMMFKELLDKLVNNKEFSPAGSAHALLQANALQQLAIIALDDGDGYQADFYGTQAADLAFEISKQNRNEFVLSIAIGSCAIVSELALNSKNKPKAAKYADMGLQVCSVLSKVSPQNNALQLESSFEKFKKKASRRFF